ncbi:ABC transporter family substrate-binding protein [Saccharomonospora iraqiensis]|uniref:ABC transporter family substrate-binding protein n=1 Tax=Saccharomonospora iraqiensis TaxID=52698 RepID=UPI00022E89BF|nr:ABC transporter family substrate-binding protein [Saccharomonospora iraqiensis]
MRAKGVRAGGRWAALAAGLAVVLTACSNTPPPPVVSSPVAQTSAPEPGADSRIVVGLDRVVGGYNPHQLADVSTVTSALSELLLPSVFRTDEDGDRQLDTDLMTSAKVTAEDPFTVTYRIRPEASWSDGAPIAVEDFVYLTEAMKNQPGVVDPAGYRLISDIRPGDGGKRVEVVFDEPYPGWKTLFDDLLPAHLLKDAPGGWRGALADSFPASGGPFAIKTIDAARGEIVLERNERYWEKPAAVDRLVLHRSEAQDMIGALRTGHDQFVLTDAGADTRGLLADLGEDVTLDTVARPRLAEVLLRPLGPELADDDVRKAVAALLDRDALIEAGTDGGASAELRAGAQVLPPSDEDYAKTLPGSGAVGAADPERARELLAEAGYEREAGSWVRDGRALSLVLAAPGRKEPYAGIAEELSRQLVAQGIEVTTVNPPPRELFTQDLAAPVRTGADGRPTPTGGQVGIDIAVVPRAVGTDPASTLASTFGCPSASTADADATDDSGSSDGSGDGTGESTDGSATTTPETSTGADRDGNTDGKDTNSGDTPDGGEADGDGTGEEGRRDGEPATTTPANPAGFCDPDLQPEIEAALSGETPIAETLSSVEPELWESTVSIPLFQLADTLALGSGVSGVTPGPPLKGPFPSAVNWTRAPR